MNIRTISLLVAVAFTFSNSDQSATTTDGRRVILFDSGTWRYATIADPLPSKMDAASGNNGSKAGGSNVSRFDGNNGSLSGGVKNTINGLPDGKGNTAPELSLIDIVRSDTSFDFRNIRWNMSRAQVKASEKAKLTKDEPNKLNYELEFLGYKCSVVYVFVSDKLIKADLLIRQDHVDPEKYYEDYDDLKKYLQPIYGREASDKCEWVNEMYKGDKGKWGFAVSIGFLSCRTLWQNSHSAVVLTISGGNHLISTNLEYTPGK
jgi:hypothetical protein